MALHRMFSMRVIDRAAFLRMPASARLLYYDLGMKADDDGFVEAYTVMRTTGAVEDDLRVLAAKGFVRVLNDDLLTWVVDWTENNSIRKDRYQQSIHHHMLAAMVSNRLPPAGDRPTTICQPTDNPMTTAWQPTDDRVTTTWQPADNQLTAAWQPTGNPSGDRWLTQDRSGQDRSSQDNSIQVRESEARESQDSSGEACMGKIKQNEAVPDESGSTESRDAAGEPANRARVFDWRAEFESVRRDRLPERFNAHEEAIRRRRP